MKKTIVVSAISLLALAVAVLGSVLGLVCRKVAAFDLKYGTDVLADVMPASVSAKTNGVVKTAPSPRAKASSAAAVRTNPSAPGEMNVRHASYKDAKNVLEIELSERPDMDVVRNYVRVEPLAEGRLTFRLRQPAKLLVSGEFAYCTNVTLRVLKGLPLHGKGANPSADGSLKEDFVYTFRRPNREPYVKFADPGRYLPPCGKRAIAIESMNVTNIATEIRRVEPANLVQMLAREEGVYSRYSHWGSSADEEDTAELAGSGETNLLACVNRPNGKEISVLPVVMADGKPRNGIYLVKTLIADHPRCDYVYYWHKGRHVENPARYRVVCVSDLGLSVRRWKGDGFGVWVTSLTTGRPVAGAEVTLYSSARIKVMEGVTDANGWCEPTRIEKGDPFALVAVAPGRTDMTFMALRPSMQVDETHEDGARAAYLAAGESRAFLWTERGIYRHDEKIFLHAVLRDGTGKAPRPFPVELQLVSPKGDVRASERTMSDANGTVRCESFAVSAGLPGGVWTIKASVPGGRTTLGETKVKIEEFAPPQIRVTVEADDALRFPAFGFSVSAEHLFGGPAHNFACEGAVVFEDASFAPAGWKGWRFGNERRGLKPSFRRIKVKGLALDRNGKALFAAPLWAETGLPKAAVCATAQGTVFEDGGRPATARKSVIRHFYPYYIGSTLPGWVKRRGGRPRMEIACVAPDGTRLGESKKLTVRITRIDSHYSYKEDARGWATWHCDRVETPVAEGIVLQTKPDENTVCELPLDRCGDYVVTVTDDASRVSFGREFYLSDWGDDVVRAPLADPSKVTLTPDKAFYRVGESPRLIVKSPFAGKALLSVMRDGRVYTEVLTLTNATGEVVLRPLRTADAPNLDVYLSVVQGVDGGARRLAVRARGQTTVSVRPVENEIDVAVRAKAEIASAGTTVRVALDAPGAVEAVVTVVDEGINLLTDEKTPDPVGYFALPCQAEHPLYDIYHRILPVLGADVLKKGGVKTGGGFGAEMLARVSPVPTRRFKPLALWKASVPVVDGKADVSFGLPEFAGEVRVTAVAYNARATGAASVRLKVSPKLVMRPDAPRFVAPRDRLEITLPVYNRAGADGVFGFEIATNGVGILSADGLVLPKDASTNIVCRIAAPGEPGEMQIRYVTRGFGERHVATIRLPVRPAVAWHETAGVTRLKAGETFVPRPGRFSWREYDSPLGDYARALEWLSDYPHGCLEQTVSRVFPLVYAGGVLADIHAKARPDRADIAQSGVRRVESMVRAHGFTMWPDVNYAPWDRDVSLYAAHFLVAAGQVGLSVSPAVKNKVLGFLARWAMSTNTSVSAYAVHTLALAGKPDRDRMYRLYDGRGSLSLLSRARLARAFVETGDRPRAEALLANAASPADVKEAAFLLLALLELDPQDKRILPLVAYLSQKRDGVRHHWGTTAENAHALMAIGTYYRFNPPEKGETFIAWRSLELPDPAEVAAVSNGLSIVRRFVSPEGTPVDIARLTRGEMVFAEIAITSSDARHVGDLVVEDLFAGALEPVRGMKEAAPAWVMRSDVRDDRMLVFSKRFRIGAGETVVFRHPMRVVSAGEYTLPGVSVEAMYYPSLNARSAPQRLTVR